VYTKQKYYLMDGVLDVQNWEQELYFFTSFVNSNQQNTKGMSYNLLFLVTVLLSFQKLLQNTVR
jgi:hypothetical protein